MAMKNIFDSVRRFVDKIGNSNEISSNSSFLLDLPTELLQTISEHLSLSDLHSLSRTCRTFYNLINENAFWSHRIRIEFGQTIGELFTFDLFEKSKTIETEENPIRPSGFLHVRNETELDIAAIHSETNFNDEILKKRQTKMFVSKENFLDQLEFYQFTKPKNDEIHKIPLMKLVFFYLIDRKRTSVVDMEIVHRNGHYLVERLDSTCLNGRFIYLNNVCWLEITGKMKHRLMPGKYEIQWRLKAENRIHLPGETEFIVVPSNGKLKNFKMNENDFHSASIEHGGRWFVQKMGHIEVYQPSIIHVAIRNWNNPNWKNGLSWDSIELKLIS